MVAEYKIYFVKYFIKRCAMEKGIFNYDNANVLKLDTNQLNENIKVIDDIFKNYEQIDPTIEIENGNTKLKLNGYFIASIISPLNLNKLNNLYVEEEFYHTYNELIVKYTEVKE
ncbi:hypothetical protein HMPREF0773_12059 [Staphylococcus aureus subsp. aureus TCH70]|nr:hypothetical protein HMPREF0782_0943 [Staphylococcus aureus subsp. aureus ATCC 51811]EFK81855.1 hypothetical protein HMPREF0773_12059 [Staphylococcus aureus subsp. aureus TCH70]